MKPTNNSLQIEQRVLENLMHFGVHTNNRVQAALLKLTADCFYSPNNAHIFSMINECFMKERGFNFVDILVLIGQGSHDLHESLAWIMDNYRQFHVNDSSFEDDVNKLLTLSMLRKQLYIAENMISTVKNCPVAEDAHQILIEKITEINNLSYRESNHGITSIQLAEAFYEGTLAQDLIIPTHCAQLNNALNGGVMTKSLITIAAGAGVGKTGFAIYLMDCIARALPNSQSLFFSLEMEAKHIWMRHVGIRAGKQFDQLNKEELFTGVTSALEIPLKIYDTASCRSAADIDFILTTARLKAKQQSISVIVVDYLGLVENRGSFDRNDLRQADITSKLAKLAMELNCVVIALSQINRGASNRASDDRCPYPQDAADSSGSHRSSTLWIGVDRPEMYQDDPSYRNQFVVKCRKNRFGATFDMLLAFNDGTFSEVPPGYFRKPYAKKKDFERDIFAEELRSA